MARMFKTEESKERRKFVKKFSKDVIVNTTKIRGSFTVVNYRKYSFQEEVDVVFKGEIYVRLGRKPAGWYSKKEVDTQSNVSTVKLNRFLRKSLYDDVRRRCNLFDVNVPLYDCIKKVKWL